MKKGVLFLLLIFYSLITYSQKIVNTTELRLLDKNDSTGISGIGMVRWDNATGKFRFWNGSSWFSYPTSLGITSLGTIDGTTKTANGAALSSGTLFMQTADATYPGLVSTGTQTFPGAKTFTSAITVNVPAQNGIFKSGTTGFSEVSVRSGVSDEVQAQVQAIGGATNKVIFGSRSNHPIAFNINDTEVGRWTTTGLGIGITSPDRRLHSELDDASTNTTLYPLRLTRTSSGTPATSIGTGMEFEVETSASNNEIGAGISAVVVDGTVGSEDVRLGFSTMSAGGAMTDRLRIGSTGEIQLLTALGENTAVSDFVVINGSGILEKRSDVFTSYTLFDHYSDAGNSGTSETDLYSDNIPANTLSADGDKIVATYHVRLDQINVANEPALTTRVYFAGTEIFEGVQTGPVSPETGLILDVLIIRESSSVVRCSVGQRDIANIQQQYTRITALTLSSAQILKITGQASGTNAATDQIVAKMGTVEFKAASCGGCAR